MARSNSMVVMMLVLMVAVFQLHSAVAETRHVVGGTLGWTVHFNGAAFYTSWASEQTYSVGDTLFFNFTTGVHNVAEVTKDAYGPCSNTSPMSIITTGPAGLSLRTSGNHYYVCTVGTHCRIGQKLTINVAASFRSTPPTAPIGTMSWSPPTTPLPSKATTFTTLVPFILLAAAVSLLLITSS